MRLRKKRMPYRSCIEIVYINSRHVDFWAKNHGHKVWGDLWLSGIKLDFNLIGTYYVISV